MSKTTISWTDYTFNPWEGCTKVSPGCAHCYAEARDIRWHKGAHWGKGAPRRRTLLANWKRVVAWNNDYEESIIEWNRIAKGSEELMDEPAMPRVFCASLADWLDDEVPIAWLSDLVRLIDCCKNLTWQLLTKRPENFLPRVTRALEEASKRDRWIASIPAGWLARNPNVWIGTTTENQEMADLRIPQLLDIPARVRFLSCEPLLGPIDFREKLIGNPIEGHFNCAGKYKMPPGPISWVICGGESGPNYRDMNPLWADHLRAQCHVAGVPFFMKQLSGVHPVKDLDKMPLTLRVREFPRT